MCISRKNMKVRTNQYDLKCEGAEYDQFLIMLRRISFSHSEKEGEKTYSMPGGKVQISVREQVDKPGEDNTSYVTMEVRRTSFFEPGYVKTIVKRLGVNQKMDNSWMWFGDEFRNIKKMLSGDNALANIVDSYLGGDPLEAETWTESFLCVAKRTSLGLARRGSLLAKMEEAYATKLDHLKRTYPCLA